MLKSNGLRHSKNPPVKFSFSLKIVPATIAKKLPLQLRPKPLFIAFFSLSHKRPTFAFTGESGYTLGFRRRIAHSGLHAETGGVSDGGGITTLGAFRTFTNIPGPGIRTASFAAFGAWSGVLPKNAESLRNSDALMRVAVPRRRGPAGLRDLFAFVEIVAYTPCAQCFPNVRDEGWYHYPRCTFRAAEMPDGRLSKGLICRFLRSCGHQGISPCPLLSPIGAKQECNNLGAGTAIVRSEQPIANAVGDAVLHGPHHRVIAIAAGRLIT